MTRNGTFCFCADGFEVGEDGTSCRGKTFGAAGGGPHCHGEQAPAPPSPLGLTSIKSFLKKRKRNRTCGRRSLCENHLSAGVYGALHPPTRQHSQNAIIPDLFCCRFFILSTLVFATARRKTTLCCLRCRRSASTNLVPVCNLN